MKNKKAAERQNGVRLLSVKTPRPVNYRKIIASRSGPTET